MERKDGKPRNINRAKQSAAGRKGRKKTPWTTNVMNAKNIERQRQWEDADGK